MPRNGPISEDEAVQLLSQPGAGIAHWNALAETPSSIPPLLNVDLIGRDLSGANLAATQIPLGRLSGTNLTGASLPATADLGARLALIAEASKNCRTLFLSLLGACVYCGLVVMKTTDGNLMFDDQAFTLPVVQTAVQAKGFYLIAPLILLGFYLYLHLYLQRLWEMMASLPATFPDGSKVDEGTYPWLLGGLIRWYSPELRHEPAPYGLLRVLVSVLLAWGLAPSTIWFLWGRSVMAHDEPLTSVLVIALGLAVGFGTDFYQRAVATMRRGSSRWRTGLSCAAASAAIGLAGVLSYPIYWWDDPSASRFASLPFADAFGYHPFATPMVRLDRKAELRGRQYAHLHLRDASLAERDLTGSSFRNSVLVGSDFTKTVLIETDLTGANLTSAVGLTRDQLDSSCGTGDIKVTLSDPTAPAVETYRFKQECGRARQERLRSLQRESDEKAREAAAAKSEADRRRIASEQADLKRRQVDEEQARLEEEKGKEQREAKEREARRRAVAIAAAAETAEHPAPVQMPASQLPTRQEPTRQEVKSAMTAVEPRVLACMRAGGYSGLVLVTFGVSGRLARVTSATVSGTGMASSCVAARSGPTCPPISIAESAGSCIAKAVKSATFPPFEKALFTGEYPFRN